jgi:hypothetical protein
MTNKLETYTHSDEKWILSCLVIPTVKLLLEQCKWDVRQTLERLNDNGYVVLQRKNKN